MMSIVGSSLEFAAGSTMICTWRDVEYGGDKHGDGQMMRWWNTLIPYFSSIISTT